MITKCPECGHVTENVPDNVNFAINCGTCDGSGYVKSEDEYDRKYGITHLPNSRCTREAPYILARTDKISDVTCRACLEEVVGRGEFAVARLVELDRDAGEEAVGGKCPHESKFQCTWCEEHFCLDHVDGERCGAKIVGWTGEIKTIATQCRECRQIEHTGDSNCMAGDCDDCPAREAEDALRERVLASFE